MENRRRWVFVFHVFSFSLFFCFCFSSCHLKFVSMLGGLNIENALKHDLPIDIFCMFYCHIYVKLNTDFDTLGEHKSTFT